MFESRSSRLDWRTTVGTSPILSFGASFPHGPSPLGAMHSQPPAGAHVFSIVTSIRWISWMARSGVMA